MEQTVQKAYNRAGFQNMMIRNLPYQQIHDQSVVEKEPLKIKCDFDTALSTVS